MFLGSYRFDGDPAAILDSLARMRASVPDGSLLLHVCVADDGGVTVFDACPDRPTFAAFSTSPDVRALMTSVGLPEPTITQLGTVEAFVHA